MSRIEDRNFSEMCFAYRLAQKWIDDSFDALEDTFHDDPFFFSVGFMMFTAKRKKKKKTFRNKPYRVIF